VAERSPRGRGRAIALALSMAWRADPWRATGVGAGMISLAGAGPATALFVREIVNRAVAHDAGGATIAALSLGAVNLVLIVVAWTGFKLRQTLGDKTLLAFDSRLIEALAAVPDVEHHERPDLLDEIELLRQGRWGLSGSVDAIMNAAYVMLHLLLTAALLARLSPWLLALPAFAIPSLLTSARAEGLMQRHLDANAEPFRRADHLFQLATTPAPAAELRVFGLAGEIGRRFDATWAGPIADRDRVNLRRNMLSSAGWLVFGLGFVGALALVGHRVTTGQATVGDLVMAMTLASEVNAQILQMVAITTWMFTALKNVGRYLSIVDPGGGTAAGDAAADAGGTGRAQAGQVSQAALRLR